MLTAQADAPYVLKERGAKRPDACWHWNKRGTRGLSRRAPWRRVVCSFSRPDGRRASTADGRLAIRDRHRPVGL